MIANRHLIPDPPQTPGVTSEKLIPSPLRAASPLQAEGISASTGFQCAGIQRQAEASPPAPGHHGSRLRGTAEPPAAASRRLLPGPGGPLATGHSSARDGTGGPAPSGGARPEEAKAAASGAAAAGPGPSARGAAAGRVKLFPRQRRTGEEQNLLLQRQGAAASASPAGRDITPPARPCPAQPSPAKGRGYRQGNEREGERRGARPPPSRASPAPPALPEPAGAPGSRSPISSSLCRPEQQMGPRGQCGAKALSQEQTKLGPTHPSCTKPIMFSRGKKKNVQQYNITSSARFLPQRTAVLVADPPATRLCGKACLLHLHRGAVRGARATTCQQGTEHEGGA
ncbi:histamine H1 receptor isoform 3-T5 [Morphnus guianensis]